eukprot:1175099-Alexandrium_andersonii.AAC.1
MRKGLISRGAWRSAQPTPKASRAGGGWLLARPHRGTASQWRGRRRRLAHPRLTQLGRQGLADWLADCGWRVLRLRLRPQGGADGSCEDALTALRKR